MFERLFPYALVTGDLDEVADTTKANGLTDLTCYENGIDRCRAIPVVAARIHQITIELPVTYEPGPIQPDVVKVHRA